MGQQCHVSGEAYRPGPSVLGLPALEQGTHHKAPTVEEIAHELAGDQFFTKADAHKAFLNTFHTPCKTSPSNWHKGRLRYKRMPFRAKMSQDMFQMQMEPDTPEMPRSHWHP